MINWKTLKSQPQEVAGGIYKGFYFVISVSANSKL